MISLINRTGIRFDTGAKLKASDLNILNNTINSLVDAVNVILMTQGNVNIEEGTETSNVYTLEQALIHVPTARRIPGMKLVFKSSQSEWMEYTYIGNDGEDDHWYDDKNWVPADSSVTVIDGGEF